MVQIWWKWRHDVAAADVVVGVGFREQRRRLLLLPPARQVPTEPRLQGEGGRAGGGRGRVGELGE